MSEGRGAQTRRVGVVARPVIPEPRTPRDDPTDLLLLLEQLAARVRSGDFSSDPSAGLLLDVCLGSVRCLLLQQTESVTVGLSPREQQIALMVANGRTNQAIAAALEISVWTVSTHLRRIFAKLAVSSRAEMVAHLRDSSHFDALVDTGTTDPG